MNTDEDFDDPLPWEPEKPIFGPSGLFSLIDSLFRGRPDAMKSSAPRYATFFDWKPISHINSPKLQSGDMVQQNRWIAEAAAEGITLHPADTSFITAGTVAGQILGTPDENGIMPEYDIVTYGSDIRGIAYYDLRPTGVFRRTISSVIAQDIKNAFRNGNANSQLPMPLPIPGMRIFP